MLSLTEIKNRLLHCLREIHLPGVRGCYEEQAEIARQESLSHEHYLLEVMEREVEELYPVFGSWRSTSSWQGRIIPGPVSRFRMLPVLECSGSLIGQTCSYPFPALLLVRPGF